MLGLDIEFRQLSVYDVGALGERFDVVLFMGVLYHLRHPLLALDLHPRARRAATCWCSSRCSAAAARSTPVARRLSVLRDRRCSTSPAIPKLHFVEQRYAGDPTNWWVPNRACAEAMLRSAGFEIVAHPEEEVFVCRRADGPPQAPRAVYPARGAAP